LLIKEQKRKFDCGMGLDKGYESSAGLTNESMSIATGPQQTLNEWSSFEVVHECPKVPYP